MTGDTEDRVRLVAAGQHWLTGSEALPIEDAICGLISDAERTLELTMFSIWTGYEFADRVWGEITAAAARRFAWLPSPGSMTMNGYRLGSAPSAASG